MYTCEISWGYSDYCCPVITSFLVKAQILWSGLRVNVNQTGDSFILPPIVVIIDCFFNQEQERSQYIEVVVLVEIMVEVWVFYILNLIWFATSMYTCETFWGYFDNGCPVITSFRVKARILWPGLRVSDNQTGDSFILPQIVVMIDCFLTMKDPVICK